MSRLMAVGFCVTLLSSGVAVGAPSSLDLSKLPVGAVRLGPGATGWFLVTVRDGKVTKLEVATEKTGNLSLTVIEYKDRSTVVQFARRGLEAKVKFDLYLSADGKRFTYTSSCPLLHETTFEGWPEPIPWIAVASARVVASDNGVCE